MAVEQLEQGVIFENWRPGSLTAPYGLDVYDSVTTNCCSDMDNNLVEIYIQPVDPLISSSQWVVIGASVQGTGHIKTSLPCQDSHAFKLVGDSIMVAAVADGLGSAERADIGSRLATMNAVSYLEEELSKGIPGDEDSWIELVSRGFTYARSKLEKEARTNQGALREYGTTLILAVLTDDWLVTGHIGDGVIVAMLADDSLVLVTVPQNDEYINVTFPLTMPDMEQTAQFTASPIQVKALALMSDGIQHVAIRTIDNAPHGPFFDPLFRQLPGVRDMHKASQNLAEFMASDQICSHTDDDKTLILIGRRLHEP
jgi:hypothetical protein